MEPIISPWFFYFVDIIPSFRIAFIILGMIFFGMAVYDYLFKLSECRLHNNKADGIYLPDCCKDEQSIFEQKQKIYKRKSIYALILSFSVLFIGLLIPTQVTLYKMMIASMITSGNLSATGEVIDKGINYIGNLSQSSLQTLLDMIVEAANKIK